MISCEGQIDSNKRDGRDHDQPPPTVASTGLQLFFKGVNSETTLHARCSNFVREVQGSCCKLQNSADQVAQYASFVFLSMVSGLKVLNNYPFSGASCPAYCAAQLLPEPRYRFNLRCPQSCIAVFDEPCPRWLHGGVYPDLVACHEPQ